MGCRESWARVVLILVLVDVGLGPTGWRPSWRSWSVLILVLVDVGLGLLSSTCRLQKICVLILVLVDVGLGRAFRRVRGPEGIRLNPCFSGCWSRTTYSTAP